MRKHIPRLGLIAALLCVFIVQTTYANGAPDDGPALIEIDELMTPTLVPDIDIGTISLDHGFTPAIGGQRKKVPARINHAYWWAARVEYVMEETWGFRMVDKDELWQLTFEKVVAGEGGQLLLYGIVITHTGPKPMSPKTTTPLPTTISIDNVLPGNTTTDGLMTRQHVEIDRTPDAIVDYGAEFNLTVQWTETRDDVIQHLRI